ncbi:MAG TPA: thymidine phosphorylase [bacterium]|nr:thymidine phosphorylase [bacterium]HPJ71542.1 thymidine phosphorylase [bacterium]HPQ66783.1 thymidine phosphorylase [bacterium]
MNAYEIIVKKRDGRELSPEEIAFMVDGFTEGRIPDYQMAAWMMAVFIRGMNPAEVTALTATMLASGDTIDLSSIPAVKVDKHSTGGVGDKVSLVLAPLVASLGVPVPMMSGRGLGHTGGTLDKLESIPGFRVSLSEEEFKRQVSEIGVAIIGQTRKLAPADAGMYALRDVTATVDSIPLIAGSIMSKKLAAGPDAFVFDVKTGLGAFMASQAQAEEMARVLVEIAVLSGKDARAVISDMNQPLGRYAGNALEVKETIACLKGEGPDDLMTLTYEIAGMMLEMGGKAGSIAEGKDLARAAISDGRAAAKFAEMIAWQGGDPACVDDPSLLPAAGQRFDLLADASGYIARLNALEMGLACVELGAGRSRAEDKIDMGTGIVFHRKVGDRVEEGDPILTIHHDRGDISSQIDRCRKAIVLQDSPCDPYPILYKIVDKSGVHSCF